MSATRLNRPSSVGIILYFEVDVNALSKTRRVFEGQQKSLR